MYYKPTYKDFIKILQSRRFWYSISGMAVLVCLLSMISIAEIIMQDYIGIANAKWIAGWLTGMLAMYVYKGVR